MVLHISLRPGEYDPLAVFPLIELKLRKKNELVGRYGTQRLVPNFKVSDQSVTLKVKSMTQSSGFGF